MPHSPRLHNIIIITSDELRADCLGYMGSPDVKTPAIDAFARKATVLPHHFCNFPKCVPSRISLFTGRRPHTDGFRDIFNHLNPAQPDLRHWAKNNGYQTALFGKSHCWMGDQFDDFVDLHSWSKPMMPFWEERVPETIEFIDYGDSKRHDSRRVGRCHGDSNDDVFVRQACHFLRQGRGFSQPFLMVLNLEKPHTPYAVCEPFFSQYKRDDIRVFPRELPEGAPLALQAQVDIRADDISEQQLRDIQAVYYGMIAKVDQQVGQVLQQITAMDLWDNSIVLFISDHGDWASQFRLTEKWDTSFNDCMVHVPCILHAPSLPGGCQVDSLSEMIDLTPTILGLLGASPYWPVHGCDLQDIIAGKTQKPAVFCDGGHESHARRRFQSVHGSVPIRLGDMLLDKQETYRRFPEAMARARMIRTKTHKMVIRETADHELYDLINDPWELTNIWGKAGTQTVTAELQMMLLMENLRTDPDSPPLAKVGA